MHLSCIATTKGKHLDKIYLAPLQDKEGISVWHFVHEEPTPKDWEHWEAFWHKSCGRHLKLLTPLDKWEDPGHRVWLWLLDEERDVAY
jgi:hypothetical protein